MSGIKNISRDEAKTLINELKKAKESLDNFDFLKNDPPPIMDSLGGNLVWKRYEITKEVLDSMRKNQKHMKKLGKDGLFDNTNPQFQKSRSKQ